MRVRLAAGAALVALTGSVLAACAGDDGEASGGSSTTTPTTAPELAGGDLDAVDLALAAVATLQDPIALAQRPGTDDLYVAEKAGTVRRITIVAPDDGDDGLPTYRLDRDPVLDISDDVVDEGEQGLLGLAFSSDGRHLYLDYTRTGDGDTIVEEVDLSGGARGTADADRRVLLHVAQPAANHNGGQLVLGPDGYLYVGLGDGGGAGDPDDTGQDPRDLLGSILRIDPEGPNPSGNPFPASGGQSPVWLYGARNPWRFTFDRSTGDLWVADVGQGEWEEVDLLPATDGRNAGRAANLGWSEMEGTHPFEGGENPPDAVLPIYEYGHADGGCSITGGYRYRGTAVPDLVGVYLFADFCRDTVEGLQLDDAGAVVGHRAWALAADQVQSFGEDADGELYVLQAGGQVSRIVAGP
jgi:hypothetical protein